MICIMPKFSERTIARLQRAAPRLLGRLGKMPNIDHRRAIARSMDSRPRRNTTRWGNRIRLLRAKRSLEEGEIVLKHSHGELAPAVVSSILEMVRKHNKNYKPKNYLLLKPNAVAISDELIAMNRMDYPSIEETIGRYWNPKVIWRTTRGRKAFERLQSEMRLNKFRLHLRIRQAYRELYRQTDWHESNVLLIGQRNGKFIFMPLLDLS